MFCLQSIEGVNVAGKRTNLSKVNEIRRLVGLGLENRAIARALLVSRNTVARVLGIWQARPIPWS